MSYLIDKIDKVRDVRDVRNGTNCAVFSISVENNSWTCLQEILHGTGTLDCKIWLFWIGCTEIFYMEHSPKLQYMRLANCCLTSCITCQVAFPNIIKTVSLKVYRDAEA